MVPELKTSVYIVDGCALLQACVQLPETFADLSEQIFNCLPTSKIVHFVTDTYRQHSIKELERERRGQTATYCIGGPST